MQFMEVPVYPGDGLCSDDACPCGIPGASIPRGEGYMFVSQDVVDFRLDAPTMSQAQEKINRMEADMGRRIVAGAGVFVPTLMCEMGAKQRGLDLEVAAADARHWWETGEVPLRATPLQGVVAAKDKSPPATPDVPTEVPVEASPRTAPRDGVFGAQLSDEQHSALDRVLAIATGQADSLRKTASRRRLGVWAIFVLAIGLPILLGVTGVVNGSIALLIGIALMLTGIVAAFWVLKLNVLGSGSLGDEISSAIEADGLPRWATVEALDEKLQGSVTDTEMLKEIDPDAFKMLELRHKGLQAIEALDKSGVVPVSLTIEFNSSTGDLQSVSVRGEELAVAFRDLAVEYLAAGAPSEALAAIAVAGTVYGRIAPPGMGDKLALAANLGALNLPESAAAKLGPGGTIEVVGGELRQGAGGDIVRKAYGVFEGFSFDAEAKTILFSLESRRQMSVLESLALMAKGGGTDSMVADMVQALEESRAEATKDPTFVEACVDHLASLPAAVRVMGLNNMRWIPDRRVVPWMLELFGIVPFYPAGIDAIVRLGPEVAPVVAQRFESAKDQHTRFNGALTLGILGYAEARAPVEKVLAQSTATIERLGCHFALARWGDTSHVAELIAGLDDHDSEVRHAAAIAVEHLPDEIAGDVFLQHLEDSNPLVRLRLLRKLKNQGTTDQKLIEVMVGMLGDTNDEVRQAAIEAIGGLPAELVADLLIETAGPGHDEESRAAAFEVLGKHDDARVEPLLLKHATAGPKAMRRAAIDGLGERGSVAAVESLVELFSDAKSDFSDAARVALIRIGISHPDVVLSALPAKGSDEIDGLRAMLGDQQAKGRLVKKLGRWRSLEPAQIASVLMTAPMVGGPEFEEPLRGAMGYQRAANFPGDRLVSHLAFGGLVQLLVRKAG